MRDFFGSLYRAYRRLPLRWKVIIRALCALVLVAAAVTVYVSVTGPDYCMRRGATTVVHEGPANECIGITDGAFAFDPSLEGIGKQIQRENKRITGEHPKGYVSIVMMLPISSTSGSIMSMTNALEQLRGAYTAQYRANRGNVEGNSPYIQLLIGNDGYQADQGPQAVKIIEDARPARHIAAVAGLGVSLDTTKQVTLALTKDQIPVIGATLTSDSFDNIKNFVRVSPANKEGTTAALGYVRSKFKRAVFVEDENSGDIYDTSLADGFSGFADAGHTIVSKQTYDTARRDHASSVAQARKSAEVVENVISLMHTDICDAEPEPSDKHKSPAVVLFAGRGRDLAELVDSLSQACLDKQITIMSGDDVTNLPLSASLRRSLADTRHIAVYYTGVANPGEWPARPAEPGTVASQGQHGFKPFDDAFQHLFQGTAPSLNDGNTMMAHDAVLTGVSAIRLTHQEQPTSDMVADTLGALHGAHTVLGASGPLQFVADNRTSAVGSNPVGKVIPILRLAPDAESRFVTLTSPRPR